MRAKWHIAIVLLFVMTACGSNTDTGGTPDGGAQGEPEKVSEAERVLGESAKALQKLERYAIQMKLNQETTQEGTPEKIEVNSKGRVTLEPLMMQQSIKSDLDGDVTEIETILMPDNFYMNDKLIGVWNKLPQEEIKGIKGTLSNFQVNPKKQAEQLRGYADGIAVKKAEGKYILTLDGNHPGAKELMNDILKSTLNGEGLSQKVKDSMRLGKLDYMLTLDEKTYFPLQLSVASVMDMEFEPGQPVRINQKLTVDYSEFNTAKPVTVPKEAKDAPEIVGPGMGDEGNDPIIE